MRLSDINADRGMEVIAEILVPVANIGLDKEVAPLFKKVQVPEGADPNKAVIAHWGKHVPALLKNHKEDLIEILAALDGVEPDVYRNKNIMELVTDVIQMLTDPYLISLFHSAQTNGQSE